MKDPRDLPYCVHTADIAAEHNAISPNPCRSINELLDMRAETHPHRLAVAFPEPAGRQWTLTEYTFAVLRDASLALAQHYASKLPRAQAPHGKRNVAMMCPSGPEYLLMLLACIRLGLSVLLLAPQLNAEAVQHLLRATESTRLLVHDSMKDAASAAVGADSDVELLTIISDRVHGERTMQLPSSRPEEEEEQTAVFFHSSGSSGMPKPIATKHRHLTSVYSCCPTDVDGSPCAAFSTTPLFHGGLTDLFRALNALEPIYFFPLHLVPVTADNVKAALRCAGESVAYFFTVPYILKLLIEGDAVDVLKRMRLVSTGGAPLSDELGDDLVKQGVKLVSRYGSSECGFLLSSYRDFETDREWQWLRVPQGTSIGHFREFAMLDDTTAELVIRRGWPHQVISNRPDGSYATGDLFVKHASIPHAWRYVGRADDILVMSNGEKTDPAPLEARLRSSAILQDAVVFGADRPATGVLLLFQSDAMTGKSSAQLVELVWPEVIEANKLAPTHSQILKEMIVPLMDEAATEGFPTASKGSIQRKQVYERYSELIEQTYRSFEAAGTQAGDAKEYPDEHSLQQLIKEVIVATLGGSTLRQLELDSDLFVFGLNSLQTARVRNVLQKRLDLGNARLASNVVYEYPCIRQLACHVIELREGKSGLVDASRSHAKMRNLVRRYGTFSSQINGASNGFALSSAPLTLLTGATGSLGAHVLSLLLSDSQQDIVCLVRAVDDAQALQRVKESLAARMLAPLSVDQLSRLQVYAVQMGHDRLDLDNEVYAMLVERTSCIIHLAWPVHFVASVDSFEAESIAGLRNLAELALHARLHPSFLFGSSVASVLGLPLPKDERVREDWPVDDPAAATLIGYSQSKWVAEKVCESLARTGQLRVVVLRMGQLCGDTQHGIWNETEGWPLMVKSAEFTGCLPNLQDELNWIPIDLCACAICEISQFASHASAVVNLVNPQSGTTWQDWLQAIQTLRSGLEVVTSREWLDRLEASEGDERINPSRKLLGIWRRQYGGSSSEATQTPVFETSTATRMSPTMAQCEPLCDDLLLKMAKRLLPSQAKDRSSRT